jgi:enoyl-CoA hydratase
MVGDIISEARGNGAVWITINRPHKHNALARSVFEALEEAVTRAGGDPRTRYILVRGAGEKYFASGGDLVELASVRSDADTHDMANRATCALDAIRNCPVPVIAYVNGDALGGGGELAVSCDMRIFASHARLGFVQGRLGITSAWGGGPDLCALVGPARALRMMSRCEMVDAELALAWGLADMKVGSDEELAAFLQPLLERSALVLRSIKAQTRAARNGLPRATQLETERTNLVASWASEEHWAAVDRFLAKDKA